MSLPSITSKLSHSYLDLMSCRKWNITGKNERGQASNLTERRQEYDSDKIVNCMERELDLEV
jgi:hypothetical protein